MVEKLVLVLKDFLLLVDARLLAALHRSELLLDLH